MADDANVTPFPQHRRRRTPPPPPPGGWPDWYQSLRRDNGRVIPDVANVLHVLRRDPRLVECFAFDEMLYASVLERATPFVPGGRAGKDPPKAIEDNDIVRLQEWLQHMGLPRIGRETVGSAVELRASERPFHPIRDYLDAVEWDGEPRAATMLATYFGAVGPPEYLALIGTMFMTAMVARVYWPGCKCDYMLVLEGGQGTMKSLACETLAGAAYFSDDLGDLSGKDAKQHLQGKWLIEESELANFTRASTETLKAFLSRTHEKYRPPYGKTQIDVPRQCVFIGTTNRGDYNKDETGARRLWPVAIAGRIDVEALKRDRDQLFAEAVRAYRSGVRWWPDPALEAEIIKPEQESRRFVDAWEPVIAEFLRTTLLTKMTVAEVAQGALKLETAKIAPRDHLRVISCMSLVGWRKDPKRTNKGYVWVPPASV